MRKILSMTDPIINSYPNYGHIFSIIGVHTQNHLPWVYNYFVQIWVPNNFDDGLRIDYATPNLLKTIPWLESGRIDRGVALEKWKNIIDFIRCYIDKEYYIYALFDVCQISTYKSKEFWQHDPVLYGYDDERQEVYFADNYVNGKYSVGIATYDEIINATEELMNRSDIVDWLSGFHYIKYKEIYDYGNYRFSNQYQYYFDRNLYVELLLDYLQQNNSLKRWCAPCTLVDKDDSNKWGIGIYSFIKDYLLFLRETGNKIDIRGFYVLAEHKNLIKKTVIFLYGEQWNEDNSLEKQLLDECIIESMKLCNLCLKYNITYEFKILDRISNGINKLKKIEEELIGFLIRIIGDC